MTMNPAADVASRERAESPFDGAWGAPFGAAPFDRIRLEQLPAALDRAMAEQRAAVNAITRDPEPPTLANTLEALERSGLALERVSGVFHIFTSNQSDDAVRALETEYSAKLSQHSTELLLDPALFARVQSVHARRDELGLTGEARRLADVTYETFVRAGAALDPDARARVAALTQREAALETQFGQNVLKDTDAYVMILDEGDLDGLPEAIREGAAETARALGHEGRYAFTLQRPSVEDFLTYSARRDLRETLFYAFLARGANGNAHDNRALITELVALRAERARLLGYASHAAYITADSMARTPEAALDLLRRVWTPALAQARSERARLQALVDATDAPHPLEGWDWRYYAEKLRQAEYDLDPATLQPYMQLDNIRAAAFHVAERLFGITFTERNDVPVYHPEVRVFEVRALQGEHVALLYCDDYARTGKHSGAWMSSLRAQHRFDGHVTALVTNNLNLSKPPAGRPTTLSVTEARTLFHELGHALHGLLSDVRYPSLSGTAVARDYVEFMSQFMEHYVTQPAILDQFALHGETGEPMPAALRERFIAASRFNQGFATCEFLASALIDQMYHALTGDDALGVDAAEFEARALAELGALPEIPMRHKSAHFTHIFAGGYSAGYYSYMWSEVLDADGFAAFEEAGDIFDTATATRLKAHVYSRGNTLDWMTGYVAFRGRQPAVEPLLRNRGLLQASDA
ncbi:MAG: M3 family metallopeptidase [Planctomycetota bacterium]